MSQKNDSVIPSAAQLVLDFFDNELSDLKFPDMDRQILQHAAERVQELADEQAKAEAKLAAAREALQEGQDQLLSKCQRALSYARIYAEEDADLSRRLEAIVIQRPGRSRVPSPAASEGEVKTAGRRGRKPAASAEALFADSAQRSGAPFADSAQRSGAPFADSAQRSGAPFMETKQAAFPVQKNGINGTAS